MNEQKKMEGFVNPYNFIAFPKKKAKAYTDEDRHTGVIHYTITTKTPLFIPNSSSESAFAESDQAADHKSYDFFSYTDLDATKRYENEYHVPVIPGSEIRGVVRNVYETLTDSCMGVLNSDTYPVKRSPERFAPALLHRNALGKWELCEARTLRIGQSAKGKPNPTGFEDYQNGSIVYYVEPEKNDRNQPGCISEYGRKELRGRRKGYLIKWGMGVKKCRYHVFALKGQNPISDITVSRDIVERKMFPMLESYLSQPALSADNEKAYQEYQDDLKEFLQGKQEAYFPVTYSKLGGGVFYLAPAIFSKEVADHNIGSVAGQFRPCENDYCPACDLFGYIGKNNEEAKGSDIRFSDLYVENYDSDATGQDNEKYYLNKNAGKVTLETLGEPKLGNVDFYLKRPDRANFWSYDYYIRDEKGRGELYVYNAQSGAGNRPGSMSVLRGRKYYWHHQNVKTAEKIEATKLNKTIRPVRPEVTFEGDLYFDGISEKQLKQLIWILNSGNKSSEKVLGLKLGGAKPLGYGSVVSEVAFVRERKIQMAGNRLSYEMRPYPIETISYEEAEFSSSVKEEFFKIADLKAVPEDVEITYPKTSAQKGEPMKEGFQWFVNNHATVSGKGMAKNRADVIIKNALPEILAEDISLPYYEVAEKRSQNFQNKRNHNGGGRDQYDAGHKNNSQRSYKTTRDGRGYERNNHSSYGGANGQKRNHNGKNNNRYKGNS